MISLSLPNPTPASRIRHSGARHWHAEPYASWLENARQIVSIRYRGRPTTEPVVLGVVVVKGRTSTSKKTGKTKEMRRPDWVSPEAWKTGGRCWRPVRPDDDNYGKAIRDALNGRIFLDDGQIVASLAYKVLAARGEEAKALVFVGTIEEMAEVFAATNRALGGI